MIVITAAKLHNLLETNSVLVIDVREPDEYTQGHIPNAINIPLKAVKAEIINQLRAEKIVMHCNTGVRSRQACAATFNGEVEKEILDLEGGIASWRDAGFEVITEADATLQLNRQVQIAVGTLMLAGLALGFFVNPWFYLLSVFMGAGLLNAGLTGWCGMAKLLALAPWNN